MSDAFVSRQRLPDLGLWGKLKQRRPPISFDLEITAMVFGVSFAGVVTNHTLLSPLGNTSTISSSRCLHSPASPERPPGARA